MIINTYCQEPNESLWAQLNWSPSAKQLVKFKSLQALLKELNQKFNLTRLLEGDDYWITQIFDSLWPLKNELSSPNLNIEVVDVGSGCGFPGLAIAIALPKAKLTLIEAIKKKKEALELIVDHLDLSSRVTVRNERVELTGQDPYFRGLFDLAIARAVSKDSVVAEYLIPLINKDGEAVLYKGKWDNEDKERLNNTLKIMKAEIKSVAKINLPNNRGIRHQIRLIQSDICPNIYPRAIGIPKKRPLGS